MKLLKIIAVIFFDIIDLYYHQKRILLYFTIAFCIFSVIKYHYRFNEERKFNELQNVDLKKSIDAEAIHSSLAGLRWITMNFPENPKTEIDALIESMNILRNSPSKKILIKAYQFISPSLLIYYFYILF